MNNERKVIFVSGSQELVLPVTPESVRVSSGIKIETVNIHALGDIRLAGYPTLDSITIDSFFPACHYNFARGSVRPYDYVARFEAWSKARAVVRFIVAGTSINKPVLVESIAYDEHDGSNDVYYTLSLAEYRYTAGGGAAAAPVILPSRRAVETQPARPDSYTVAEHDSLRSIGRRFYGDPAMAATIAAANGIKNQRLVDVGKVLVLP